MAPDKKRAGTKPRPAVQLAGEQQTYSRNEPISQAMKAAPVHLVGGKKVASVDQDGAVHHPTWPRVEVVRRNGSAFVRVVNRPWGWPNQDREFLNPDSPAVERYADKLREQIFVAADTEAARRERIAEAKHRERMARLQGRRL